MWSYILQNAFMSTGLKDITPFRVALQITWKGDVRTQQKWIEKLLFICIAHLGLFLDFVVYKSSDSSSESYRNTLFCVSCYHSSCFVFPPQGCISNFKTCLHTVYCPCTQLPHLAEKPGYWAAMDHKWKFISQLCNSPSIFWVFTCLITLWVIFGNIKICKSQ